MRETRAPGYASFPYPIYPEVGGLIILGNGRNGEEFYWLRGSDDPDEWSVVVANSGWTEWGKVSKPMSQFLLDVRIGQIRSASFRLWRFSGRVSSHFCRGKSNHVCHGDR